MNSRTFVSLRAFGWLILLLVEISNAPGHPGSGMSVDKEGNVYFVDTGLGLWNLDSKNQLIRLKGEAWHFLSLDLSGTPTKSRTPRVPEGDIQLIGDKPRLVLSS